MLEQEKFTLVKISINSMKKKVKDDDDVLLFEKFFARLLDSYYASLNLPFNHELSTRVVVDLNESSFTCCCVTRNSVTLPDLKAFRLFVKERGYTEIKKSAFDFIDVMEVYRHVFFNWESVKVRINKVRAENVNYFGISNMEFAKEFELLFRMIGTTANK